MRFCDLRRTLFGGYRREDVLECYQRLMKLSQSECEQLERQLEAGETIIHELSEENEALHMRVKRLEEQVARYEQNSKCL